MKNTLESYKLFPFIAWSLVIGFALFVYFLTVHVGAELGELESASVRLEYNTDTL